MDSRTAAHFLAQIGALLEIDGGPRFNARAYRNAARAILALGADDLGPLIASGELMATPGIGPATLSVVEELLESGESSYLRRLIEATPLGLIEMARVPGLSPAKVHLIHGSLGIETIGELEQAALDGRLAKLPRFGAKTAGRVLKGIEFLRRSGGRTLYHRGLEQAVAMRNSVLAHPDVSTAVIAGSARQHCETIGEVRVVAVCRGDPAEVAHSFGNAMPVMESSTTVLPGEATISIRYVDEARLRLTCVSQGNAGIPVWRETGSAVHVTQMREYAAERGMTLTDSALMDASAQMIPLATEAELFAALDLDVIPPELREGMGEIEAAAARSLPALLTSEDILGVLHCHSTWSDGSASIAEMAGAARRRGWTYLGVTDHSQAAFYAGGMKRDEVLEQHEEIDKLNSAAPEFRILKGIEVDILSDGRLDYDDDTLDLFDFVIGSVHSRFSMGVGKMTARVLAAMEDPRLTILGHPTGRLLLSREGYPIDLDAVIERAAETGVALELNADPHRLDLDWRELGKARERGVIIEIGPDAHSEASLDNVHIGVGIARKAWLRASDVLNAMPAERVLAVARARKSQ
ncbi:MAG: PHP domain-containing protein [Gemmatimonadaceae bacterium]